MLRLIESPTDRINAMARGANGLLQRGSALVEAVIVIPVLLMLIGATYEMGAVFQQYLIIQQIAYEGARAGSQLSVEDGNLNGCYCYDLNTGGAMRSEVSTPALNLSLTSVLTRVDTLLTQSAPEIELKCDDRDSRNYCSTSVNENRPSFAAEYLKSMVALCQGGRGNSLRRCGYSGTPQATQKDGTLGIRVSGKYDGRVFPFSFYLTAESRARILTANQDFSGPRDSVSGSFVGR